MTPSTHPLPPAILNEIFSFVYKFAIIISIDEKLGVAFFSLFKCILGFFTFVLHLLVSVRQVILTFFFH